MQDTPTQHDKTAAQRPLATSSNKLDVGMVINSRYRLDRTLGAGGMGVTFLARDLKVEQETGQPLDVVVKAPLPKFFKDRSILRRFRNEATMHQSVNHPRIAQLLAVEAIEQGHRLAGLPFIVLQFIDGTELHRFVDKHQDDLTVGQFLKFMADVAAALSAVHEAGLVHRDVKPRNIMVLNDQSGAVLVDFGLALGDDLEQIYIQSEGAFVSDLLDPTSAGCGTPAYMSPEMWEGIGIGPVSDVYGLGVMIYEFLTGSYPFTVRKREDFKIAHMQSLRTPPSSFNTLFTTRMDQVLLSALQKAPAFRPSTPDLFIEQMIEAVHEAKLENLRLRALQRESVPNFFSFKKEGATSDGARLNRVHTTEWSQEDRQRIRRFEIFHGMSARDVLLFLEAGLLVEFEEGQLLFNKGELGDKMYVILEGEVEIFIPPALDDGDFEAGERIINRCGPGSMFGEIALLLGDTRTASIRATKHVRALGIAQQELDLIVARPHRASLNLLINLARSVARTLKDTGDRWRLGDVSSPDN